MEDILKLRSDTELYIQIMNQFVSYVVLKLEWNDRLRSPKVTTMGQLATTSDEALALLILENNYDRWIDILEQNRWKPPHKQRGAKPSDKRILSNVRPKYTNGGNFYETDDDKDAGQSEDSKLREKKGWTDKGVARFNALREKVIADRQNPKHKDFFHRLREHFNESSGTRQTKKAAPKRPAVIAQMDPFTDDEDDISEVLSSPTKKRKSNRGDAGSVSSSDHENQSEHDDDEASFMKA